MVFVWFLGLLSYYIKFIRCLWIFSLKWQFNLELGGRRWKTIIVGNQDIISLLVVFNKPFHSIVNIYRLLKLVNELFFFFQEVLQKVLQCFGSIHGNFGLSEYQFC